jgi:hypothetical protein
MKNSGRLWATSMEQSQKKQNVLAACSLIHPRSFTVIVNPARLGVAQNPKGIIPVTCVRNGHAV